ncbi:TonB-dependent receptor [Echinimonas agarilytica]|uniref:TonB-dependent receptor n=1 Tax=Echinimonas agarilytica TaxID=1215918 RepID=A0AA42B8B8_9GAMM|nr:TonB-dependent receptor [Echinimonas agarilytica]MCM2680739.1 TonB-dependent receptor [Echinimonas agarilytica]
MNIQQTHTLPIFKKTLLGTIIGLACFGVNAVENETDKPEDVEIISVSGMRASSFSSINEKRSEANLVDAVSLKDIGALPDNSIAETLERISGVTADRYKGGASEISIRGLGPFLGMSTINGRAISSGSGNRSVAFSQFPSELVNGVKVYKSQSAELLEGGVSGTVELGTIRPVDYGKERLQAEAKVSYSDYQAKQKGEDGIGHRLSFSYVNSFEIANDQQFGFAIGYAGGENPRPEDSFVGSSTLRPCNSDYAVDGGSNCSFKDSNEAANGGAPEDGDYYFISNMQSYRQMESVEDIDAVITAVQWQPNSDIDINLDAQWSERFFYEDRHDLSFDDGRRKIHNWTVDKNNVLQSYSGETRIGNTNEYRERNEEYKGFGANINWQVTDELNLTADAAYSGTERYQDRTYVRFRSKRKYFNWEKGSNGDFPNITVLDGFGGAPLESFPEDIKSLSFYNDDSEARQYRLDVEDEIKSFKLDANYFIDAPFIKTIRSGIAYSTREHQNYQEARASLKPADIEQALADTEELCSISWPQKDYGDDSKAPFTEWATIDTRCGHDIVTGGEELVADAKSPSDGDVDLTEDITAFYLMANFETEIGDYYLTGNVGARYVKTEITSVGVSQAYTSEVNGEGFYILTPVDGFELQRYDNSFNNLLPSLNMTLEVNDDVELRFAAYKAVSRPDMWFYGAGRDVNIDASDEGYESVEDALDDVTSKGNPNLELLESNNFEFGVNWYFADESMFSIALYHKAFEARIGASNVMDTVTVDGQNYAAEIKNTPTIFDDESDIDGFEVTLMHQFVDLPAPFDGLGFSGSYNYADSDYETPEAGSNIPEEVQVQVEPGNLPGLSEHVANAQLYWEGESAAARIAYKYRSEYLKPFGSNLGQTNRYVEDQKSLDLSLSYNINNNFTVKAQAMNLTEEPALQYRVAPGAYNQVEQSGRTYYVSLRYRM